MLGMFCSLEVGKGTAGAEQSRQHDYRTVSTTIVRRPLNYFQKQNIEIPKSHITIEKEKAHKDI